MSTTPTPSVAVEPEAALAADPRPRRPEPPPGAHHLQRPHARHAAGRPRPDDRGHRAAHHRRRPRRPRPPGLGGHRLPAGRDRLDARSTASSATSSAASASSSWRSSSSSLGSVLSGLATSMSQLIGFRAVQGIGAGGLIVLAQAIIADVVSPRERGRYQGYFGAVFGAASVAGPLLGGFLTDHLSWRWVFYVNVPLGILALLVTSAVLPASVRRRARAASTGPAPRCSPPRSAALVLLTTWGGNEYAWGSTDHPRPGRRHRSCGVAAFVCGRAPGRRARPCPLRLFRNRTFNLAGASACSSAWPCSAPSPTCPRSCRWPTAPRPATPACCIVPLMLGLLGASIGAGQIITRTGRYRVFPIVGMALAAAAMFLLSTLDAGSSRLRVRRLHGPARRRHRLDHADHGAGRPERGARRRPGRRHLDRHLLPVDRRLARRGALRRPVQRPAHRPARQRAPRSR